MSWKQFCLFKVISIWPNTKLMKIWIWCSLQQIMTNRFNFWITNSLMKSWNVRLIWPDGKVKWFGISLVFTYKKKLWNITWLLWDMKFLSLYSNIFHSLLTLEEKFHISMQPCNKSSITPNMLHVFFYAGKCTCS